jgi:hypothetical protein
MCLAGSCCVLLGIGFGFGGIHMQMHGSQLS